MTAELESCPLCGALPIDQVDSHAVEERVRNRYTFSRQGLLDGCALTPAAEEGELIASLLDWAETIEAMHGIGDTGIAQRRIRYLRDAARLLSSPRVEEVRRMREALQTVKYRINHEPLTIESVDAMTDLISAALSPQGGRGI